MPKKFLNPFLFLLIDNGQVILWDYKHHQQFEIASSYLERLLAISRGDESDNIIDEELLKANIISFVDHDTAWGWDHLSKIFHIGTQNIPIAHDLHNDKQAFKDYIEFCENAYPTIPVYQTEKNGEKIILPEPDFSLLSNMEFLAVLKNRKTSRSFNAAPVSLKVISTLLYLVFGNIHGDWSDLAEYGLEQLGVRKSSPSAGALHSSEAYLVAVHVEELSAGIYHYQSHNHTLSVVDKNDMSSVLGYLLAGQHFAEKLSAGIFISARFEKNWHKYKHSKGYHHILLDIGHLSQTFQLCVTAMGFQTWLSAAFLDDEVVQLLKLQKTTEYPMFFVGMGQGDGHSLSQEMRQHLQG